MRINTECGLMTAHSSHRGHQDSKMRILVRALCLCLNKIYSEFIEKRINISYDVHVKTKS